MKILILSLFLVSSFQAVADGALGYSPNTATTASSTALTDAQYKASQEYIHEGLVQRKYDEACTGKERECSGREVKGTFMGMDNNMVRMVAKTYGMIIGSVGMMSDKKDYCALIPAATETIATFQQQANQENLKELPTNQTTAQKDALYKASRSHEARADSSKIQFTGFAAATACYPAQMSMTGGFDWASTAKMAASGFLAFFYKSEIDRYKEAAAFTKKVADELPGKGECNPINQKDCYCAQPESKNYPEYTQTCLPATLQRKTSIASTTPVTCLDTNGKVDSSCECTKSNTCYDKTFSTQIQGLSFREGVGTAFAPVASLTKGSLSDANLSAANTGLQSALGKLRELDNKFAADKENPNATDVKALQLSGLGPNIARKLAAVAPGPNFQNDLAKINARYSGSITLPSTTNAKTYGEDSHLIEFGGGPKNKKSGSSTLDFNKFLPGQKQATKSTGQVLDYPSDSMVNNAMKGADINSDSSKNLFDIVSRRYQLSAPQRLGSGF